MTQTAPDEDYRKTARALGDKFCLDYGLAMPFKSELEVRIAAAIKAAADAAVAEERRRFPMQDGPRWMPWPLAEVVYEAYSKLYGNGQSLERLAERAGFCFGEVALIFEDLKRYKPDFYKALIERQSAPTT